MRSLIKALVVEEIPVMWSAHCKETIRRSDKGVYFMEWEPISGTAFGIQAYYVNKYYAGKVIEGNRQSRLDIR